MVDPKLLEIVRSLYTEWTGMEIADAHRLIRKELELYELKPTKILGPANQVVDPPTAYTGDPKPKVPRVSKKAVHTDMPSGSD